jgi:ATP-binding protein involved in chromosome partitioning
MTQQDTNAKAAESSQKGGKSERKLIAISSGKGGVGKSTVTTNIAVALAQMGLKVGVVDADIYGPSIPGMLGIAGNRPPAMSPDKKVIPAQAFGVKVMSMAMLSDDDSPAILRGPMVTKYLQMFVAEVEWGELDVLLLDLPPGTGDIQLTLAQAFPLTGAVVVSTPQDVSLKIARRGLRMMQQVNVPILGIVENMSGFACGTCGEVTHIFSKGGGEAIAREIGMPFLGAVPIEPEIVDSGDAGKPMVIAHPNSAAALVYVKIAEALVGGSSTRGGLTLPFDWHVSEGTGQPAEVAALSYGGAADVPVALDHDEIGLMIRWQDGYEQTIGSRDLRLNCRCAACRDEMSGAAILDPSSVPQSITPTRIWSLGNYGLGLAFSDGHSTGIYTFKALRAMQSVEVEDV